ncbi:hypothetical protein M9Y10_034182 [Tritrichomonas musculus]|uniref:Uncharacterized protein n=1 Tax=Tritrichomonas musculus TaxID=1915356 RepID=A0ABR2KE95_9EUKA
MSSSNNSPKNLSKLKDFLDWLINYSEKLLQFYIENFDQPPETDEEIEIPQWFPASEYYFDIMKKYDEALDLLNTKKAEVKAAIKQLKKEIEQPPNNELQEEIRRLQRIKTQLLEKKESLVRQKVLKDRDDADYAQKYNVYKKQLAQYSNAIQQLLKEKEKKEEELRVLMKTVQNDAEENQIIAKNLKNTAAQIHQMETFLQKNKAEAEHFQKERDLNYKKNEALTQQMKSLSIECTEAKHKIDNLKEQLQDHNQMIAAFDLAKKQLEREKSIEATVIDKMKEAVSSAESFNEEAERLKRESLSLRDEVNRTKQQLSDTLANLKSNAKKKIEAINSNYEIKIIEADKQFTQLLNDNAQLLATNETLRRQLTFLEQQNSILRSDDGRSKTGYDEFCRGATSQLEMLQSQLEDLTRESQKLKDEEQKQRMRLTNAESESEKAISAVRKNVDKLESDLAQVKASLSEAEAQGSALLAENNRLNSELTKVSIDSKREVELKIAERENEIRLLTSKLDEIRRNHVTQTADLQRVLINTKRHADKWKQEAENVAVQSEQGLEETEEKTQIYSQKIASLNAEIERQEGEAVALQQLVAKRQQEARDLQVQYEAMEKRVFDQKTQLDALYEQQLQFATQREDLANRIDQKKTELKRLKREQAAKSKYNDEAKKKK